MNYHKIRGEHLCWSLPALILTDMRHKLFCKVCENFQNFFSENFGLKSMTALVNSS